MDAGVKAAGRKIAVSDKRQWRGSRPDDGIAGSPPDGSEISSETVVDEEAAEETAPTVSDDDSVLDQEPEDGDVSDLIETDPEDPKERR